MFIRWIYVAMSSHPDVAALSNISPEKRGQLNREAASLIVELLTVRCKDESQQAVKYEGGDSFKAGFEQLGRVAMQGLMSHPDVKEYLSGLESSLDVEKLKKTFVQEQQ